MLSSHSKNAPPLKANGRCRLKYYIDGEDYKQSFPVKFWVNPPAGIYLQGDIAFDPKGLIAGSNEIEFWLAVKLKEISSYWWGRWEGQSFPKKLLFSPKMVLEALGTSEINTGQNWTLSSYDPFEILIKRNEQGTIIKKIHISNQDYLVREIHYFNDNGKATVTIELSEYKKVLEGFWAPTAIKIIKVDKDNESDSAEIALSSIKATSFTDKQCSRLFSRPDPQDFKHIYKIIDGNIIEQP